MNGTKWNSVQRYLLPYSTLQIFMVIITTKELVISVAHLFSQHLALNRGIKNVQDV